MEEILAKDFNAKTANGKVIVDFYGVGCMNCRMLEPTLCELESQNSEIKFLKVNIDTAPELIEKFNITALPTLLFIKDGKILQTLVGLKPKNFLVRVLNELFN